MMRTHLFVAPCLIALCGTFFWACAPANDETAPAPAPEAPAPEAAAEPEAAAVEEPVSEAGPRTYPVGDSALLEGIQPEGWNLSTGVEHYQVENLYNKINGRSEMYMSYNVRELTWAGYVNGELPGRFIDVFVYDMQSASGAFGVYAAEREAGQESAGLGRESYASGGNCYFWKGQYYAYVQSSHDDEQGRAAGLQVAQGLDARLADNGEEVRGIGWLPTGGLIEDSITYFLVDALSLEFMTDTFTARYDFGLETEPVCFITRRENAEDAAAVYQLYLGYLEEYGMSTEVIAHGGLEISLGDLGGGYFDGGFVIGDTVAGISAVRGKEEATAAIKAFADRLAE